MKKGTHSLPETPTMAQRFELIAGLQAKVALLEAAPTGLNALRQRIVALETANVAWAKRCAGLERRVRELEVENAELKKENAELRTENQALRAENAALRRRLGLDSANSSIQPSKESLAARSKRRSPARKSSGKSRGGQTGHRPSEAPWPAPTKRTDWKPVVCSGCGGALDQADAKPIAEGRVIDVAEGVPPEVESHVAPSCSCRGCGAETRAALPDSVPQGPSYGPRFSSLAVQLAVGCAMGLRPLARLMREKFGISPCNATILSALRRKAAALLPVYDVIGRLALGAAVRCIDETPMRIDGGKATLHGCATESLTFLRLTEGRGDSFRPESGVMVTDFFSS
jgi:hypothetical protein